MSNDPLTNQDEEPSLRGASGARLFATVVQLQETTFKGICQTTTTANILSKVWARSEEEAKGIGITRALSIRPGFLIRETLVLEMDPETD